MVETNPGSCARVVVFWLNSPAFCSNYRRLPPDSHCLNWLCAFFGLCRLNPRRRATTFWSVSKNGVTWSGGGLRGLHLDQGILCGGRGGGFFPVLETRVLHNVRFLHPHSFFGYTALSGRYVHVLGTIPFILLLHRFLSRHFFQLLPFFLLRKFIKLQYTATRLHDFFSYITSFCSPTFFS